MTSPPLGPVTATTYTGLHVTTPPGTDARFNAWSYFLPHSAAILNGILSAHAQGVERVIDVNVDGREFTIAEFIEWVADRLERLNP